MRAEAGQQKPPQIFLHVGEPKTGSTHLQQVMWRNRAALALDGVMLPGPRPLAHWRAAMDLREVEQLPNDPIGSYAGAWDRISRQAQRAPRAAVISHELFAAVSEDQAKRALASFGDAEVHVILGVRDFATLIPAEWQESVKHRSTRGWHDWLGDIIDHEADADDRRQFWFWRVHDTLEILRIWSQGLPPERVHVVTVPPRGSAPDLLWQRFAGIIGARHKSVDPTVGGANASLGLAETELLRQINLALPEELPNWFYMNVVKDQLAAQILANEPKPERLELPKDRFAWAAKESKRVAAGLRAAGVDIVGDLSDLAPVRPRAAARHVSRSPDDLDGEELLRPALSIITSLLAERAAEQGIQPRVEPVEPARQSAVKRALIRASHKSRAIHGLRRGYWDLANAARRRRRGRQGVRQ
ncbi:MAG TPA: hypothetical protein VHB69_04385 [Mycobacteriales bacterium]|nr:hypothetical protein [Mycobacteriales bacterium]